MKLKVQFKSSFLIFFLIPFCFSACTNSTGKSGSRYSKVTLRFENSVDNAKIRFGALDYLNASGNAYSVALLKYYVSNVSLVRGDDSVFSFQKYLLVNAADSTSWTITLDSLPNGVYKELRFDVGVDSAHNHSFKNGGNLDSSRGMIAVGKLGYTFFKHDGSFKDSAGVIRPLMIHLETDNALAKAVIPLHGVQMDGGPAIMSLLFNLNEVYRNPTKIDFNKAAFYRATDSGNVFWIKNLSENLSKAFSLDRID